MRAILAGLLMILAACSQTGNSQPSLAPRELPMSGPVADAPGKLVYGNGRFLRALVPSTGAVTQLLAFPSGSAPDAPTVSPDGKLIAFSVYHEGKDSDDPASGIDLWVMNVAGGGDRVVLAHHGAGEWLVNGAWSPDGHSLYFTRRSPADAPRIERVRLDGSERKIVVDKGESPTISRDGRWLAYLSDDEQSGTQDLSVEPLTGGASRALLAKLGFKALAGPRFAPDGARLAFVAVGGPSTPAPSASRGRLPAWLGAALVSAHGVPWELWVVNTDGTGIQRFTDLREDSPRPAWSPDGKWLALKGELGMYLLGADGKHLRRIAQELAGDGLAWTEP